MDTTTTLSPARSRSKTSSPEFEFWMLRNPSFPQPNILSADELFVDGVLLPLHLLPTSTKPDPIPKSDPETPTSAPAPEPSPAIIDSVTTTTTASKRWKDIFRKSNKKTAEDNNNNEKPKKKEKKGGASGGAAVSAAAELNINIWPFSRSRSARNAGTRPRLFPGAPAARRVNSAPCSRSNSAGESKSRKWPSSPGRGRVHLGRSSPVWQVRRGASASASKNAVESLPLNPEKSKRETATTGRRSKLAPSGADNKTKVLNVNVPICIGHRHNLTCRSDGNSAIGLSGGSGGKIFTLRSFFTKKSIVTSH